MDLSRPHLTTAAALALALCLGACGNGTQHEITETRELPEPRPGHEMPADSNARFGGGQRPAMPPGHPPIGAAGETPAMPPGAAATAAGGFAWAIPTGWEARPSSSSMRLVTTGPAGRKDVECYVTILGGAGGGLAPNMNRWREQMGRPALSEAEIAALPKISMLGRESPVIEIEGDAAATGGTALALYGAVCELGSRSIFVKMTGPAQTLQSERERFVAFCTSFSAQEGGGR